MKKSFSLLEIIFTVVIVSIIATFAIPKLFYNINTANIIKLRADVALIRDKINKFHNKQILANTNAQLDTLENGIIPILSDKHSGGNWSKITTNTYKAWINSDIGVEFIYKKDDLSFNCDFNTNKYCKDLTQ